MDWGMLKLSDYVGMAGFALAAILAGVKIYELFRDRRPKLSIVSRFTSDIERGHDVVIHNASNVPASIYSLELVWIKPGWWSRHFRTFRRVVRDEYSDDEFANITVLPHSQYTLNFDEGDHFAWTKNLPGDLYLRLWLIGTNSPKWFLVLAR